MSDARTRMLAGIRRALNRRSPLPDTVAGPLRARLDAPTANLQPAIPGETVEHFAAKVVASSGRITRVADLAEVPDVVGAHLDAHGLPGEIVVAPDPRLEGIRWSNRFSVEHRGALDADRLSVTSAFAGVAETGSVVLLSGPESPTGLNFLPEHHLVVLDAGRVVRHTEDVWTRIRTEVGRMPRTVNFITGPSKTGDIELVIYEGAHGPRVLHVILVGG